MWPVHVTHFPTRGTSARKPLSLKEVQFLPHRANNTLETEKEECSCQVHHLVRLGLVARCRLAGTQEGEEGFRCAQLHKLQDRELAIWESKPT